MTTLTIIEWACRVFLATCFLAACGFFSVALFNALTSHNTKKDNDP